MDTEIGCFMTAEEVAMQRWKFSREFKLEVSGRSLTWTFHAAQLAHQGPCIPDCQWVPVSSFLRDP